MMQKALVRYSLHIIYITSLCIVYRYSISPQLPVYSICLKNLIHLLCNIPTSYLLCNVHLI